MILRKMKRGVPQHGIGKKISLLLERVVAPAHDQEVVRRQQSKRRVNTADRMPLCVSMSEMWRVCLVLVKYAGHYHQSQPPTNQ